MHISFVDQSLGPRRRRAPRPPARMLPLFAAAAVARYGLLLAAWVTVFIRTVREALNGRLLLPAVGALTV